MKRCYNKNASDFKYYGGRGIIVCERWQNFDSFVDDMAKGYKKDLTLDRINNDEGYGYKNCRWANYFTQCNNRRNSHYLFNPQTKEKKTISEWARLFGISRNTITSRIRLGYKEFNALISGFHAIRYGKIKFDHFKEEARRVSD